jgi:hypothetical protein
MATPRPALSAATTTRHRRRRWSRLKHLSQAEPSRPAAATGRPRRRLRRVARRRTPRTGAPVRRTTADIGKILRPAAARAKPPHVRRATHPQPRAPAVSEPIWLSERGFQVPPPAICHAMPALPPFPPGAVSGSGAVRPPQRAPEAQQPQIAAASRPPPHRATRRKDDRPRSAARPACPADAGRHRPPRPCFIVPDTLATAAPGCADLYDIRISHSHFHDRRPFHAWLCPWLPSVSKIRRATTAMAAREPAGGEEDEKEARQHRSDCKIRADLAPCRRRPVGPVRRRRDPPPAHAAVNRGGGHPPPMPAQGKSARLRFAETPGRGGGFLQRRGRRFGGRRRGVTNGPSISSFPRNCERPARVNRIAQP